MSAALGGLMVAGAVQVRADFPVDSLDDIYDGLPGWAIPFFWLCLALVIVSLVFLVSLAVRAQREYLAERRRKRRVGIPELNESQYLWVFMVPALNEEVTIADAVHRLALVNVTHSQILVINDGSQDATAAILESMRAEIGQLTVLTRVAPNARQGKSQALNDAWRYLHDQVLGTGRYAGWDPAKVLAVIVDADGRLDPDAGKVAYHFDDERVGGVQAQVRIYNQHAPLTLAQDLEFGIFGSLFQLGRSGWGTANMGGNGQFNRLSALDQIAVADENGQLGPWRAGRLTEDQDIGLRLLNAGWTGRQASDVTIQQQGLHSLRKLFRQRVRWSQGGWQVLDLIRPSLGNKTVGVIPKLDQCWYLLTPIIQVALGLCLALSVGFLVFGLVEPGWRLWVIVFMYLFSAVPGIIGVLFARRRPGLIPFLVNILVAHLYVIYSWLIYPVVYVPLIRHLSRATSWTKTNREEIALAPGASS